jgi:lipoprotein NlpI
MLVEMGDLEAAGRHLKTLDTKGLEDAEKKRITVMQIMVWLQIGDLRAAKRCLAKLYPASEGVMSPTLEAMNTFSTMEEDSAYNYAAQVLHALTQMAEGNFALAAPEWSTLLTTYPNDDMAAANRAICLLYMGQFSKAIAELQEMAYGMEGMPHHALLFNLCTFYELSTERAAGLKTALTERLVEKAPSGEGWQRAGADFKMDIGGVRA